MIQNVFRAEGLPLDLAYIPIIESWFKTNALSKASAKGPWQFMKPTAQDHGLKTDWFIDERSDPGKGHRRRGEVPEDAAQDVQRRLAPGARRLQRRPRPSAARHEDARAGRLLDARGVVAVSCRARPASTCRSILAAIIVARNPAQYGFEYTPADRSPTTRWRCRARWTCAASPSGPGRRSTRSRR